MKRLQFHNQISDIPEKVKAEIHTQTKKNKRNHRRLKFKRYEAQK